MAGTSLSEFVTATGDQASLQILFTARSTPATVTWLLMKYNVLNSLFA